MAKEIPRLSGKCAFKFLRQGLVAFQARVGFVNCFPQRNGIHLGVHTGHGVGARHGSGQPFFPEPGITRHLQSVEASHARHEHDQGRLGHHQGGDAWFQPAVGNGGKDLGCQPGDIFQIGEQTAENLGLPFQETFPFQFGDYFNEALHLLVVFDG